MKAVSITGSGFEDHFNLNSDYPKNEGQCCLGQNWWYDLPKDALPVSYCSLNSMHGLKYVAEPQRHLSERICWLVAFLIGVGAAAYMINSVWDNYRTNPVIVSFKPTETDIKDIPFPAITICSMNLFPKSLVEQIKNAADDYNSDVNQRAKAQTDLQFIKSICKTTKSFSQMFDFAYHRGRIEWDSRVDEDFLNRTESAFDLMNLLVESTMPCEKLVRLCVWSEEIKNCSKFFKPIITEFGKCCTFNVLPPQLLLLDTHESAGKMDYKSGQILAGGWEEREINKWRGWDYTKDGFVLNEHHKRPFRQIRAGIPFGLTILLDGNTDEYFCTESDSVGFRLVLHTALEMPPVQNWGVALGLNKEIFVEIAPELTLSDPKVGGFDYEKRKCFFQSEKSLQFYSAYTTSNCLTECIANATVEKCGCVVFHMPRNEATRICSTRRNSTEYLCSQKVRADLTRNYRVSCKICDSLCTDIFYHYELTQADLQDRSQLWNDPRNFTNVPSWAHHEVSIVHIYYAFDSFVPRVRSELYATVDLIANTGGLLGLCLGFSALSAVEFIYFFTMRLIFTKIRKKLINRQMTQKIFNVIRPGWTQFNSDSDQSNFKDHSNNLNVNQDQYKSRMDKNILSNYNHDNQTNFQHPQNLHLNHNYNTYSSLNRFVYQNSLNSKFQSPQINSTPSSSILV